MGLSSFSPPPYLGVIHTSTAINFWCMLDKNFCGFYRSLSGFSSGERGMEARLYTGRSSGGYPTDEHFCNHIWSSPLIHLLYDYYY